MGLATVPLSASVLDAIIAAAAPAGALPRSPAGPAIPLAPPPSLGAPGASAAPSGGAVAPVSAGPEAKRAAALARFLARRAEAAAPRPPEGVGKPLHCPICRTGSRNRQGVVSHLRQVHGLDKPARDSAMATAGI